MSNLNKTPSPQSIQRRQLLKYTLTGLGLTAGSISLEVHADLLILGG
jgi:hypothetical protein